MRTTRYSAVHEPAGSPVAIWRDNLRNWEQGRRQPEGPARVLLKVAAHQPEALLAVSGRPARPQRRRRRAA